MAFFSLVCVADSRMEDEIAEDGFLALDVSVFDVGEGKNSSIFSLHSFFFAEAVLKASLILIEGIVA